MSRRGRFGVRASLRRHDEEPLALLVNLFECGVVLALAIALEVNVAKRTAEARVPDERTSVTSYTVGDGKSQGEGTRLGIAYRLADGQVIFVPEGASGR